MTLDQKGAFNRLNRLCWPPFLRASAFSCHFSRPQRFGQTLNMQEGVEKPPEAAERRGKGDLKAQRTRGLSSVRKIATRVRIASELPQIA